MSYFDNKYIEHVKNYVENYTPVQFMLNKKKVEEVSGRIHNLDIDQDVKHVIIAGYALLYTAFDYHLFIKDNNINKSYNILVGDYISSYVSEIFYSKKLYDLTNIFIKNTKKISIYNINASINDTLLEDIVNYYTRENNNGSI